MAEDPFNLQRFVDAQAGGVYERALAEIRAGEKRSPTAKFYGLSGDEEARA